MKEFKVSPKLIKYIEENTYPDEIAGDLVCNKCKSPVRVDWFEQEITCTGCDEL